jgi:hypothetical protein
MQTLKRFFSAILFLLCFQQLFGVSDTLVFNAGNKVIGEIKKMEKGVLEIDVPYGDSNFKIKWLSIKEIYTESKFLVSIRNEIYEGRLASISGNKVKVFEKDTVYITCDLNDIVYINQIIEGFSNRFSASLEVGFNLTKAENMQQFSLRSAIGYKTDKSSIDASYNMIRSSQSDAESVRRTDGLLNYRRVLFKKWYGIATIATLSNTEQLIDLRANSQLGLGNYIYATNRAYWGIKGGVNNNLEKFANENDGRNSWEGYLGTELNLYDIGDLNLNFVIMGYKGFTDNGRYRADTNLDVKYDLPFDLFIRLGFSLNYDNEPAVNASETDYVLRTGIGWEW